LGLAWIRPPGALVFLAVVLIVISLDASPARRSRLGVIGLIVVSGAAVALTLIESAFASRSLDAISLAWFMTTAAGDVDTFQSLEWADQSLGRQLLPATPWQAVLYTPVRAALYWISPL